MNEKNGDRKTKSLKTNKLRNCDITWTKHPYKGMLVNITHPKVSEVSKFALILWRQILPINGGSLFDMMPQYIRDIQI